MPGMNGLMLIEEARRRLPGLPALLLTGYADTGFLPRIEGALTTPRPCCKRPCPATNWLPALRRCSMTR